MPLITSRRSLITGLVSLMAAPAIVRLQSIMPVKAIEAFDPVKDTEGLAACVASGYAITCKAIVDNLFEQQFNAPNLLFVKALEHFSQGYNDPRSIYG
jgi:hypothetical protein